MAKYQLPSSKKMEGKFGWWYKFWWTFLLGAEVRHKK